MGICNSATDKKSNEENYSKPNLNSNDDFKSADTAQTKTKVKGGKSSALKYSRIINNEKDITINANNVVALNTGTPLDNYIKEKQLGEGSYGAVFKVKNKDTGQNRAMKKILNKLSGSTKDREEKEKEIMNEIEMLKSLDHPNIVKVFEFYNTEEGYFIITDLCREGELFDKIVAEAPFEESAAAYIMYQLLRAVFYCHNMNIIHRDLKPENILVESVEKDTGYYNIKVIDFGTAKIFDKNKSEKKTIGSAYYIAPEVLNNKYNEKCDVWSCGVIMYILLSGLPPFNDEQDTKIYEKIKIGKYDLKSDLWKKVSSEAKDLIKSMLQMNSLSRISAQKALTHKWFKKFKMRERFTNVGEEKLKQIINNIRNYKSTNKLQQVAWAFLVHNSLHLPEVKDIYKVFQNIDQNSDGRITKEELSFALAKIYNVAEVEDTVEEIFSNVDNDNNGYIEYEEYIRASINKEKVLTEANLKYSFKFFDKDNSGEITIDEIISVISPDSNKHVSESVTKELIRTFDDNADAKITLDEYKEMMLKLFDVKK